MRAIPECKTSFAAVCHPCSLAMQAFWGPQIPEKFFAESISCHGGFGKLNVVRSVAAISTVVRQFARVLFASWLALLPWSRRDVAGDTCPLASSWLCARQLRPGLGCALRRWLLLQLHGFHFVYRARTLSVRIPAAHRRGRRIWHTPRHCPSSK